MTDITDPTNRIIKNVVYKTFKDFATQGTIKISEFVTRLELEKLFIDEELIKFSKLPVIRALILMELKSIKSHHVLSDYLKSHEEESLALEFYKDVDNKLLIPDQRSFSYFVVHKLTENEKKIIELIAQKIRDIAEKFDIAFDVEFVKPIKKPIKETNFQYQKEQRLAKLSKRIKKIVYPKIKINLRHNAKYTKNSILNVLVHSALEGSFTHGGALSFRQHNQKSPASNTILYHLKKHNPGSVKSVFMKVSDEIFKLAKASGVFKRRKPDISIDYTFQHYYGDRNNTNIVFSKQDHGTIKYFRYITLDIVENGIRFTLCALPAFTVDREVDLVRELLEYAKSKININKVYMDRGFANSKVFNLLQSMGLKYVIPLPEDKGIKKLVETSPIPFVHDNYKRGDGVIKHVVLVQGKKGLMKIATNIPINNHDIELIENLPRMYGKRWGIETGYRVKKREGLVKTTSNNYAIRLFYFLFSVALYNLWSLVNLLLILELCLGKFVKRVVTFKLFLKALYEWIIT